MKNKMKNSIGVLLLILSISGINSSCKHRKELTQTETKPVAPKEDSIDGRCRLDYKNAKALSRLMQENEFDYTWIFAKATVESFVEEKEESFDIRLSLRKDSAMLVNIQYVLGINVAKVLITRDSVKFVDYIHKTYFVGDFAYINDLLSADLDFDLLQSVLFGNSAKFYDEDARLKPITDRQNCNYILSTERKKRLNRIINGVEDPDEDLQIITLNPDNFKIIRNEFEQSSTGRKFIATYSEFVVKDSVYAPYHVDIDIQAQKNARLKINYVRIEKNSPQKLTLNIPAKYDAIQIQKK
jgi:hypothetical protein